MRPSPTIGFVLALLLSISWNAFAQDTPQPTKPQQPTEAPDAVEDVSFKDAMKASYGLEIKDAKNAEEITGLIASQELIAKTATTCTNGLIEKRTSARSRYKTLNEQLSLKVPSRVKQQMLHTATLSAVDLAHVDAAYDVCDSQRTQAVEVVDLLKVQFEQLVAEKNVSVQTLEEKAKKEQLAIDAVEKAKRDEAMARDETMRGLLQEERQFAEQSLALTRELDGDVVEIEKRLEQESQESVEFEERIRVGIKAFGDISLEKSRRTKVDPVFRDLQLERRLTREAFNHVVVDLSEHREKKAEAELALVTTKEALSEAKARALKGGSDVLKLRERVAESHVAVAEKRFEKEQRSHLAFTQRLDTLDEHLLFLDGHISTVIDKVSSKARDDFYAFGTAANWSDAFEGVAFGVRRIVQGTARFLDREQGGFLDMLFGLFGWIFGFIWRFAIIFIALRWLILPSLPRFTRWLNRWMFQRKFFARRPLLTVKLSEIVRATVRPIVFLIAALWIFDYVQSTFAATSVLDQIVSVFFNLIIVMFLYMIVSRVIEVIVLPKWYRIQQNGASVDEDDENDDRHADVLSLEISRAKKLVWSAKAVLIFGLISVFLPRLVELVIGLSVLSRLVTILTTGFFFLIFFWIISIWKNELADVFDRLASLRLPRAATFVKANKDRWYGVIIIGLASFYVMGVETKRIVGKYVLNTEWFQRASNLAFRTKIEMQSQKKKDGKPEVHTPLPELFTNEFEQKPIGDDPEILVIDDSAFDKITTNYKRWSETKRQGSVAIVGEPGSGKTTFVNKVFRDLKAEEHNVVMVTIDEKLKRKIAILRFLADVFDIEPTDNREILIRRIQTAEPKIIVLDDCHHFFMRQIGGFDGLETLLDVVNLTDETHFFILSFNAFAWSYVNRVSPRAHYFGEVVDLDTWGADHVQELIEKRCVRTGVTPSFSELVVTREGSETEDYVVEVVKTANGYFRYLHEFTKGNPSVALEYWLRSLKIDSEGMMQVSLFTRPKTSDLDAMSDAHWFVLTAIAQHGELDAVEIAATMNLEVGCWNLALNYFEEKEIISVDIHTRRARLTPLYFRQVLKHLANANFLYR